MRVLIVDDSDIALSLLENALVQAGYTVDTASNGHEALECLHTHNHRLVISDWDMPEMDGVSLCRAVRATAAHYVYFILLTHHQSKDAIVTGLSAGADDFIAKPFHPAELLVRVGAGVRLLSLEMRDMAIFAMAKLAESRDNETGQHLERVRKYAEVLARQMMQMPKYEGIVNEAFVRLLYETTPLHDIGKVGIPDRILLKPGKLSREEYAIMRTHTTLGQQTLEAALDKFPEAQFLRFARDIAAAHHEWFDGTGYPNGLAGDDIPLCARIVAVADVYDALTTDRVYRARLPHEEARRMILEESGTHFDPDVIDAFLAVEEQFIKFCRVLSDSDAECSECLVP